MRERYGWPVIGLHWLTLLLIAAAILIAALLDDMPLSPLKLKMYSWHKWLGLTVLFLLPLRVLLRKLDPFDHRVELTPFEVKVSAAVHGLIYLLMIIVPLFGWLYSSASGFPVVWLGVLPMPDLVEKSESMKEVFEELHEGSVALLISLIVLHAAAAIYHHHVRRDGVLTRMLPWLKKKA